jgi:hypothetical protein
MALFALVAMAAGRNAASERPVMKIVRMLQDMAAQLEKEKADDEAVFASLDCWCKTNKEEKSTAIAKAEAKMGELKSSMGEFSAKIEELREGLASTKAKLREDTDALATATAIRMKEVKSFHEEEKELMATILSVKQALKALKKHNSFTQVYAVAKSLDGVKTMQLAKNVLGQDKLEVLKAFLQEAEGASSTLRGNPKGHQSYAPQSGQIFGILGTMQEEFEASLSDSQKEEEKAKADFAALKSAKEAELGAGKDQQAQLEQDDANFREKNQQAYEEFNDTQAQLEIDQEFLMNLNKKCAASDEEFEKRTADRMIEIKAVEDTIVILNSDESFEAFGKSVNSFMQVSASTSSLKRKAADVLRSVKGGDAAWQALAAVVELDGFAKAKAAIDKMVADLTKQQSEEVTHKDWCEEEMQNNKQETEKKYDQKTNLESSISDLTKTIDTLTKSIKANEDQITTTQAEMKKASEIREGENADFQQTMSDQRITQAILKKAIDRMNQAYSEFTSMMQAPGAAMHVASATHTDPGSGPAKFKKMEQNAGGDRVIAMLTDVLNDSKKMENDAAAGEQDAQSGYEMFMKDSNKSVKRLLRTNVNQSEEKAKAEEALSRDNTDLSATMKTLEGLNAELGDLHQQCDFVLNNFSKRQEARALEMDALREAKNILSGMK